VHLHHLNRYDSRPTTRPAFHSIDPTPLATATTTTPPHLTSLQSSPRTICYSIGSAALEPLVASPIYRRAESRLPTTSTRSVKPPAHPTTAICRPQAPKPPRLRRRGRRALGRTEWCIRRSSALPSTMRSWRSWPHTTRSEGAYLEMNNDDASRRYLS
jgi:hypothetical protein